MSDGYQHLETIDSKNPSMKTERTVQARTRHMIEPTSSTSWKDAIIDAKINWGNQNTQIGLYRLEIKNKTFTLDHTRYWGIWSFD